MAGSYLQIDRVTNINLESIRGGIQRLSGNVSIPKARSQAFTLGVDAPAFTINGEIVEATRLAGEQKFQQLIEIVLNPEFWFSYIAFPDTETVHDGFYVIESLNFDRDANLLGDYLFQLVVRRIGTLGSHRVATYTPDLSTLVAETITGWSSLTSNKMVSVPNGATLVGEFASETRAGEHSSLSAAIKLLLNPTKTHRLYTMSATLANWFYEECHIFDSVTAGNTDESQWVRVYSSDHIFGGDVIVSNGFLRYIYTVSDGHGTFYGWGALQASPAWLNIGLFKVQTSSQRNVSHFEITKLSSEEVRWREIRGNSSQAIATVEYVLRRGAYHCKITLLAVDSLTTVSVVLSGTGYFDGLFNASDNDSGGNDLTVDATNNYHCGFTSTSRNIAIGFVLLDKPTLQPDGVDTATLAESKGWSAGQKRTIFVFAFPTETNPLILANARSIAAAIAAQCMYAVEQKLILMEKASWYA